MITPELQDFNWVSFFIEKLEINWIKISSCIKLAIPISLLLFLKL